MNGNYDLNEKKKILRRKVITLVVVLVLLAVLGAVAYRFLDQRQIGSGESTGEAINVVKIGGKDYRAKTRVKSYLFMGIDKETQEETGDGLTAGQCDVLQLVVIDQNANTYAILPINRDTITEVKSLDDDGSVLAETEMQIALAHANGDGGEVSCENTVDAVSNYLNGQKIDGYAALNMDAIGVINHLAGGVTVTIEDDFSEEDPSLKMGETIKLDDEQAVHYVRGRMDVGDGTNENRMKRQSTYMNAVSDIFKQKMSEDEGFVMEVYDALQDYMVTDINGR